MTPRETLLAEAARLTAGDRDDAYGPPFQNLTHMADMASAYLSGKHRLPIRLDAEDMAWLMVFAKAARTVPSARDDNYIDAAAYAAIAGECRQIIEQNRDTATSPP
jgi:hypothetical protein